MKVARLEDDTGTSLDDHLPRAPVVSDWQRSANRSGRWEISTGRYFADAEAGKGLRTVDDNSYYAISARLAPQGADRRQCVVGL